MRSRRSTRPRVEGVPVHLKIDTGMQRVGVQPDGVAEVIVGRSQRPPSSPSPRGVFTHLAMADRARRRVHRACSSSVSTTCSQRSRCHRCRCSCTPRTRRGRWPDPAARRSFVRAGIAIYGISPGPGVDDLCRRASPGAGAEGARSSFVKRVAAGSGDLLRAAAHRSTRHDGGDGSDRLRRRGARDACRRSVATC